MARQARTPNTLRWIIPPPWDGADELARRLRTGRLMAQLLHNRGLTDVDSARAFLTPKLADLHDPQQLPGAVTAAELILAAIRDRLPIVLYGDYDVDGLTGVAILFRCLNLLSATVDYYIPHRIEEGYGLNEEALANIAAAGAKMVITVDCGISSNNCAELAQQLGIQLVITDHHTPPAVLPPAAAIVHPTANGQYPNPHLCGAGVAFKLAWQICRAATGNHRVAKHLSDFLLDATSMAALGTIADVVPLIGENRAIATYGLRGLTSTQHPGIQALIAAAGLQNGTRVSAYDVGFQLAPRLNAAGRMGHAAEAAELLIRAQDARAAEIAAELTRQNSARQQVERQIFEQAAAMVAEQGMDTPDHRAIVLASDTWHAGVIGIVASRLVGRFCRPAVLIAMDGDSGQGSARSIQGYNIASAFSACSDHLLGHGGHAMAAGLKVQASALQAFRESFMSHSLRHIDESMLQPSLKIDAETSVAELSVPLIQQIQSFAPCGAGNPPVVLAVRKAQVLAAPKRMGRNGGTLGLLLGQGDARIRCVGFGMGDFADRLTGVRFIDVAGEPTLNHYNGRTSAELTLKDVRWD